MRKIISGRKYDTDTAREVGTVTSGEGFARVAETLYQKRTGEYFLHGCGGPATRYAERVEDSAWAGGDRIMPLTYEQARQWAEDGLDADAYIAEFGDPGEGGDGEAVLSVRVPEADKRAVDGMAARHGMTKAEVVSKAIRMLADHEGIAGLW